MLLDESWASTRPVGVEEPHFAVFPEFRDASYAKRYEILCQKLVREGLYDSAAFVLSNRTDGLVGGHRQPNDEIAFRTFAASLVGRISGAIALQK